jgi:NADP-dependent 3-hydroxy acid dehydrogenase YdfG
MADGVPVVQISLSLKTAPSEARLAAAVTAEPVASSEPRMLDLAAMAGRVGAVPLASRAAVAEAFPRLAAAWGQDRLAALIATSRLVGMECPGLYSLYSELRLAIAEGRGGGESLRYAVTEVDERFRTVDMEVVGPGLDGTVSALARLAPVEQPGLAELRSALPAAALADRPHHALIIGGSRGLGALTARLVAAGGGKPTITYAVGRREAEEVAEELGCQMLSYDVRLPAAEQLAGLKQVPTHLYYFATGHIFRRPSASFSDEYFAEYARFYVTGLACLLDALRERGANNLVVFYPSTTALDEPVKELAEYAAAKAAGEQLCRQINAFNDDVHVEVLRLPRLLTDQTATSSAVYFGDSISAMASVIQAMHARGRI